MKRPAVLPLSDGPGFIPCGPGRPMTDEQRERVFGPYLNTFMQHLADITDATAAARRSPTSPAGERLMSASSEAYIHQSTEPKAKTDAA